jgi:hypothetical protein
MKAVLLALLILPAAAPAANLGQDLEILRIQMRIDEMWREDQAFRAGLAELMKKGHSREQVLAQPDFSDRWKKLTQSNTEEIKQLLTKWGWPAISRFGSRTDAQTYDLIEHASPDPALDELSLLLLAKALEKHDTHPSNFASLWDLVRTRKHLPQRYGTQGECKAKGLWEAFPLEDPREVNRRRHAMGMESLEDLTRRNNQLCLIAPNQNE